jgi:hypothetical protein
MCSILTSGFVSQLGVTGNSQQLWCRNGVAAFTSDTRSEMKMGKLKVLWCAKCSNVKISKTQKGGFFNNSTANFIAALCRPSAKNCDERIFVMLSQKVFIHSFSRILNSVLTF